MSMNQQATLNQLSSYFYNIAQADNFLKGFYFGPKWDINENYQPIYPLLAVIPQNSLLKRDNMAMRFDLYCVDANLKDVSNRSEIMSDCLQTLLAIKAYINKDFSSEIFTSVDSTLEPQYEILDDDVAGYKMGLEINIDWLENVCQEPGLSPTGSTFQINSTMFNVNMAGYLPLTGGNLTGNLSGTSSYFNQIYLSGVSLYDTFLQIGYAVGSATTQVQAVGNIYTGGTPQFPIIHLVDSPVVNNFTSSGVSSFTTLSATTYISGSTNLYSIFQPIGDIDLPQTQIQNGLNTYTGGTTTLPTVNVSAATLTYLSATTISGGTFYSGSTPLSTIINSFSGTSANLWSASTGTGSVIANNGTGNKASGNQAIAAGYGNLAYSSFSSALSGYKNSANNLFASVVGGRSNIANGEYSFIGGGAQNKTNNFQSAVVGGYKNYASANWSFIGGGKNNTASGAYSFIGSGKNNIASGAYSTIINGNLNVATGFTSVVMGWANSANTSTSTIAGGSGNTITGINSFIGGGAKNKITAQYGTIGGGRNNTVLAAQYGINGTIAGGNGNNCKSDNGFIGGGAQNYVGRGASAIAGGYKNKTVRYGFIGGGAQNYALTYYGVIGGGNKNVITYAGTHSAIGGGSFNKSNGSFSSIGGGWTNYANGNFSVIAGGRQNTTSAKYSAVLGGSGNTVSGAYSSVVGGQNNKVIGNFSSILAGSGITATNTNTAYLTNLYIVSGGTLTIQSGSTNPSSGSIILTAGTAVINSNLVSSNCIILLSNQKTGGTLGILSISKNVGVSFTITSTSNIDTSTIYYLIVQQQ